MIAGSRADRLDYIFKSLLEDFVIGFKGINDEDFKENNRNLNSLNLVRVGMETKPDMLNLLYILDKKDYFLQEYENAVKSGTNPRDSLKKMYRRTKETDALPATWG